MKKNILIMMLPFILAGCKDFKKSIDDTLSANRSAGDSLQGTATLENGSVNLEDTNNSKEQDAPFASQPEKLNLAEQQLRDLPRFKGKPIYIYQDIHFYADGRIIVKLQTPENPNFVDEYTYSNGQWQQPEPVLLSKNDDVQADLICLDKIPFKNANNVYKILIEKGKEIGSNNENQVINAGLRRNKIVWHPGTINSERYRYDIEYNEDGTLKSFEQQ